MTSQGVVRLYTSGLTSQEVADRLGLGRTTVLRRLKEAGVETRKSGTKVSKEEFYQSMRSTDLEARALYENGMSVHEVAARLRLSASVVKKRLRRSGARMRGRREAGRLANRKGRGNGKPALPEGSRRVGPRGYVFVKDSSYFGPGLRGWVPEHILVWESAYGPPSYGHVVHHMNGNKQDNRLENLVLLSGAEHRRHHLLERRS